MICSEVPCGTEHAKVFRRSVRKRLRKWRAIQTGNRRCSSFLPYPEARGHSRRQRTRIRMFGSVWIIGGSQMTDSVLGCQERRDGLVRQAHLRALLQQDLMWTRLLVMLSCLVAVGIAIAVGPLSVGPNGDLVVSLLMMAVACTSRGGNVRLKAETVGSSVCCTMIKGATFKSAKPVLSIKSSLRNHQKTAWARTIAGRTCSPLTSGRTVRFFK